MADKSRALPEMFGAKPFAAPEATKFGGLKGPTIASEPDAVRNILELTPEAQEGASRTKQKIDMLTGQLEELLDAPDQQPDFYSRWVLKGLGINWQARDLERKLAVAQPIMQTISNLEQQHRLYTSPTSGQVAQYKNEYTRMIDGADHAQLVGVAEKIDPKAPGLDNWRRAAFVNGPPGALKFTDFYKEPSREEKDKWADRTLSVVERVGKIFDENEYVPENRKPKLSSDFTRALLEELEAPPGLVALGGELSGVRATSGDISTQLNTHPTADLPGNQPFTNGTELNEYFYNTSLHKFAQIIGHPFSWSETTGERAFSDIQRMSEVKAIEEDIARHPLEWFQAQGWVYDNLINKGGNAAPIILGQNRELRAFISTGEVPLPSATKPDLDALLEEIKGE